MKLTPNAVLLLVSLGLALAAALGTVPRASAQAEPPVDPKVQQRQAQELYFDGLDLKDAGDCEGAVARFQAALDLSPQLYQARLHLAECYHGLGLDEPARAELEIYLAAEFPGAEVDRASKLYIACGGSLPGYDDSDDDDDDATGDDDDEDARSALNLVPDRPSVFVAGIHVGPGFSAFSPLGLAVVPRLEVGVALPFGGRRVQLLCTVAYQAPSADGVLDDGRVGGVPPGDGGGSMSYSLLQRELMLGAGANIRFRELGRGLNPYVAVAPQLFVLETITEGEVDGKPTGENRQRLARFGLYAGVGVEVVIGPGALFAQLGLTISPIDGLITGSSNTGALIPAVGYRFML